MRINSRAGLTYAIKYAAYVFKQGIGVSKREVYAELGGRTPYVHSYSTFNRYMGIVKEFVNWAKARDINRVDKLQYDHVRAFIEWKAERGLSEKTLKLNMSALEKFADVVGRKDIAEQLRRDYTELYTKGRSAGRALPFTDPKAVIEKLKGDANRIVAELQYLTGARVGDVKKIRVEGNKVIIEGSKGGRSRVLDFSDRAEKLQRIAELTRELDRCIKETGWKNIRVSYYVDLKQAVQKSGEVYTGAHAFRVNYAAGRFQELIEKGYSEQEADRLLTRELGHNRVSMSRYYRSL